MLTVEGPVSLLSVWTLGLALGLTACTVTCLPFVGTWAMGRAEGGRVGMLDTMAFLAGRLVAYTLLGALAGALGAWFVKGLAEGIGHLVIGLTAYGAALWLVWPGSGAKACLARGGISSLSPFLMGGALTLIPCAPLGTLLATCAAEESATGGALYGAVFGLGALISPMLVLIPAAARFGELLKGQSPSLLLFLRAGAALVLLLLGWRRMALVDEGLALGLALTVLLLLALAFRRFRSAGRGATRTPGLAPIQIFR